MLYNFRGNTNAVKAKAVIDGRSLLNRCRGTGTALFCRAPFIGRVACAYALMFCFRNVIPTIINSRTFRVYKFSVWPFTWKEKE